MPVQSNPNIQNVATIAFLDLPSVAAYAPHADIRQFIRFGWSFEVIAALATDVTFAIESAPPSAGDNCVPGDFEAVNTVPICADSDFVAGPATVTIPAGTPVGTICAATIPCRPNAFVRITSVSAEAGDVAVTLVRQGPRF